MIQVFCKECEHLGEENKTSKVHYYCDCAKNWKFLSNWHDRRIEKRYKRKPCKINKRNRCKWYDPKEI